MDTGLEHQLKKIREQISLKAAHQQQHAAMLLAVEETINEQGMVVEPSSYFGALLTLLEQQTGSGSKKLSNAIIYLLSIILPHVSTQVLRAKFSTMMAVLSQSLDLGSADVALLRSVVACLEAVLQSQDVGSWNQPVSQGTFKSLLALSIDTKPKIRKRAQEAVSSLLSQPPLPAPVHPAAPLAVRFVLDTLGNAKADTQSAIYTLQLVKSTNMTWPPEEFKELCESFMQLPKLNTPFLTTLSFQALESVFSSAATSLEEDQFRDLLVEIIDLKPSVNDPMSSEAWLKIVQNGYIAYASISPEMCFESLPDLIDLVLPDIELGKQSTKEIATQCIWAMIRDCIPTSMFGSEGISRIVKTLTSGLSYRYRESWALVFLVIAALFQRLGDFAHPAMDALMVEIANMRMEPEFQFKNEADAVLGAALRAVGPKVFLRILPLNIDASSRQNEVGRAWLLPLMKNHIRNAPLGYFTSTLLPIADSLAAQSLRFTSQGREIEAKVFVALCHQVWALLSGFCNVPSDVIDAFTPGFAARLSKEIEQDLLLRPSICAALTTLLTAIHHLAHKDVTNSPLTKQQALAAEEQLAQFAPDFLSQMFNVFAQSPGASRGYIMDTITAFLAVISEEEVNATFVKVCTMLDEVLKTHTPPAASELTEKYLEAHPPPHAYTMMDLATTMAPYLDSDRAQMLARAAFLLARQNDDATLQKKGYKAIVRLAEQPDGSPAHQLIESSIATELIPMLLESAETVAISSRRDRLALISRLSRNLPDSQIHFIPAMLSEVILGTKEPNERARTIAFDTLLVMGKRMAQGGAIDMSALSGDAADSESPEQPEHQASIYEYFKIISAGLAAQTPHMISATIASISRALFEFHEQLDAEFIVELMGTVLMFVVNNNREIAKSSLGFVKVIAVVLPKELLEPHLKEIVPAILKWSHEYKNQLRLKCRHILDRLSRRLGLDVVAKSVPEEHAKLVTNMRKRQQRAKRPKGSDSGASAKERGLSEEVGAASSAVAKKSYGNVYEDVIYGSESELDDSDDEGAGGATGNNGRKGKKTKKQQQQQGNKEGSNKAGGAWIKEDTDGPLDFLDRSAFTHFATANPAEKPRRPISVPKMRDGKLLFEDPEEEARKAKAAASAAANNGSEGGADNAEATEDYYLESVKSKEGFYRTPGQKIKFHKRKAGDSDDDVEMGSDGENNGKSADSGPAKRGKGNNGAAYGREFKSKKGKGDIKRGGVDPFAYIPLNPKSMKKGLTSIKGISKKEKRGHRSAN